MNEGGNASEGSISISFPGKERIERLEGTGSSVVAYFEGNLIQGKDGEMVAQYPLAELTEYDWVQGRKKPST